MSGKGVELSFCEALDEITNRREFDKAVDSVVDGSGGGALGGNKLSKRKTTRELARRKARAPWEVLERTYAPNDGHEVVWVRLWESTRRVHLVNKEGDIVCAEFLDEEMGEKVIVAREVVHVHNFGGTPFCSWLFLVASRRGGDDHQGWHWEKERKRGRGDSQVEVS
jgi:hypothetical protein